MRIIDHVSFGPLLEALKQRGYALAGPTVRDHAIVYDTIDSVQDLPVGWTEEQQPGRYRLKRRSDRALFGFTVGPQSWKKYLFPPRERLWQITRPNGGSTPTIQSEPIESPKLALIGVRACELAAIRIQDEVFLNGPYIDHRYQARRRNLFVVAVNCGHVGQTCFCSSMDTGPRVSEGFDLALTELMDDDRHEFAVESGTDLGAAVLEAISSRDADPDDRRAVAQAIANAEARFTRRMETTGLHELLEANREHPRWAHLGQRCTSCGNCTMVCPTCFCSTITDHTDLTGGHASREREWDSCFAKDFSYIVGGHIRSSAASRYRQWMTHKLSGWHEQFGMSGCVGCGRCIAWCPVGIDITEEIDAIRQTDRATRRRVTVQECAS